jgi:hypothetical protein
MVDKVNKRRGKGFSIDTTIYPTPVIRYIHHYFMDNQHDIFKRKYINDIISRGIDFRMKEIYNDNDLLSPIEYSRFDHAIRCIGLKDQHIEILILYFQFNYSMPKIGEKYGLCRQRIREIIVYIVINKIYKTPGILEYIFFGTLDSIKDDSIKNALS